MFKLNFIDFDWFFLLKFDSWLFVFVGVGDVGVVGVRINLYFKLGFFLEFLVFFIDLIGIFKVLVG